MLDVLAGSDRQLVASISTVRREDLDLAGGKGANLGELIGAGFPVPDGFLVSTAAYASAVEQARLEPVIAKALTGDDGAIIRDAFWRAAVPDAAGAAFAGQQDSYLNVVGTAAVLDAVRRCWASLWTDRAIAYRRHHQIGGSDLRIAVVVQRMVDADVAGVMFTANPVTGARDEVVLDASRGLGEAM